MHDAKAVRDDPAAYARGWASRGMADADRVVDAIVEEERELRVCRTALQAAQSRRNEASKLIGAAKAKRDTARADELMAEVEALKADMVRLAKEERVVSQALWTRLAELPNLPVLDLPQGADEHGNVEQKAWGDASAMPAARLNKPKDHVELGEALGMMDFEAAARMSGARFVVLKRDLARLERALGQFMLDLQTEEHGYTEVSPPLLVKRAAAFGTGQLPKFADDLFATATEASGDTIEELKRDLLARWGEFEGSSDLPDLDIFFKHLSIDRLRGGPDGYFAERQFYLIPTAEVSLTNLVREQITPEDELPLRLTALTPCFRSEAGASGRDTRGMIRQHQFIKCELVSITTPDQSDAEHERMTTCAEAVLERLGLPYRRMLLCTGDMGFTARKTYDLEVWLPSQDCYREISSVSNCGDFQARRLDARTRKAGEKGTRLVHTLNGSGLAVGRTLVALMENYQDEGGRIAIPESLQPYMRGQTHIGAAA